MPVPVTTLLRGYREAYSRWMIGPRVSGDLDGAFLGIFEALNWAVVVDDGLREVMPGGRDGRMPTTVATSLQASGTPATRFTTIGRWRSNFRLV